MISNDALKLLKWMAKQDKPLSQTEIQERCRHYKDHRFKAITSAKYLKDILDLEGEHWAKFQINDSGVAYIEGAARAKAANVREWLSFGLSVAAIIISIIALVMQLAMQ